MLHGFPKAPIPFFCVDIVFMVPFHLQTEEQKPKPLLGGGNGGRRCNLDWVSPDSPGRTGRVLLAWQGHRGKAETGTKADREHGVCRRGWPCLGGRDRMLVGWGAARAEVAMGI